MISHKGLLSALTMLTGDEKSTTVRDLAQFVLNTLAGKTNFMPSCDTPCEHLVYVSHCFYLEFS